MNAETLGLERWRVAFFGTPKFAIPSLSALVGHPRIDVSLVITQPDRPAGRHRRLTPPPVKTYALDHHLPIYQPESLRGIPHRAPLVEARVDLFVVAAFGLIFGERTLAIPRLGCVNVHASCLPKYRGAAPVAAAILAGESETGISLMKMTRGLDTGPVIAMNREPIFSTDTTESLTARLAVTGGKLLTSELVPFAEGKLAPQPQPEAGASLVRPLQKADGWLDWSRPAAELERQVRAMWPWPRAWTTREGQILQIHQASAAPAAGAAPPGTPIATGSELFVACGEDTLRLDRVQLAGGKTMTGAALLNGRHIAPTTRLGASGPPPQPPPFIRQLDKTADRESEGGEG